MVPATIATSDPPATDFCIWAHPFLSSPVQSSWLNHFSPSPTPFLLAPGIAPDSLPCLPCPPAVTFSIPSYICPNSVRDEGWRLQSVCPWRRCKKDKPSMWKDLDIYLPKGKKLNRRSCKVMPVLKIFQRLPIHTIAKVLTMTHQVISHPLISPFSHLAPTLLASMPFI